MPRTATTAAKTVRSRLSAPVLDVSGKEVRSATLADALFGVPTNATLVSEVIVSAQANRRHAIADTLRRGEVRGGGKKPWRQKGTGRARQGSTRAPHWRHGGVAFGPTSAQNFQRKINAKARAAVVRMLLSDLASAEQIRLVDGLTGTALSTTKAAAGFLNAVGGAAKHPLLLTASADAQLLRSARNLAGVMIRSLERLGLLDLVMADQLIIDLAALELLEARYAPKSRGASVESGEKAVAPGANSTLSSQLPTPASKQKKVRSTSKTAGQEAHE